MDTWILVIALIGNRGHAISQVEFNNRASCEAARPTVQLVLKDNGAPGWASDGGVFVKAVCVKK
jgi:hypothetical protein